MPVEDFSYCELPNFGFLFDSFLLVDLLKPAIVLIFGLFTLIVGYSCGLCSAIDDEVE